MRAEAGEVRLACRLDLGLQRLMVRLRPFVEFLYAAAVLLVRLALALSVLVVGGNPRVLEVQPRLEQRERLVCCPVGVLVVDREVGRGFVCAGRAVDVDRADVSRLVGGERDDGILVDRIVNGRSIDLDDGAVRHAIRH